jgi:hypothetical protein
VARGNPKSEIRGAGKRSGRGDEGATGKQKDNGFLTGFTDLQDFGRACRAGGWLQGAQETSHAMTQGAQRLEQHGKGDLNRRSQRSQREGMRTATAGDFSRNGATTQRTSRARNRKKRGGRKMNCKSVESCGRCRLSRRSAVLCALCGLLLNAFLPTVFPQAKFEKAAKVGTARQRRDVLIRR